MAETKAKSKTIRRRVKVLPWRRHRFTDAQYDAMVRAGVLSGTRAFLWDGEIVEPMAEDQPHLRIVSRLFAMLLARFDEEAWAVNVNQPVAVAPGYRPEPDLSVLRGSGDSWAERGRVPRPEDVALLIEIADSSYSADIGVKLRKYAEAGVKLYWIVNVAGMKVEVYTKPVLAEGRFANRIDYGLETVIPISIDVEGGVIAFEGIPTRQILRGIAP